MRTPRSRFLSLLLGLTPSALFGQGSLTPPGAPAPTMKSLDQVEARIIVNAANCPPSATAAFVISKSGSYYLPGNIAVTSGDGIAITATGVTLDLNGYTISSSASTAANSGIYNASAQALTIRNGHIKGTTTNPTGNTFAGGGFFLGIYVSAGSGVRIENVTVTGVGGDGINVQATEAVASHCVVDTALGNGILVDGAGTIYPASAVLGNSVADHCAAIRCGKNGIQAGTVDSCNGSSVGTDSATCAINGTNVINSSGTSVGGTGVSANVATGCTAVSTSGVGLYAALASNSYGYSNSQYGISCITASNCTGQSHSQTAVFANTAAGCYGSSDTARGIVSNAATNCTGTTNGTTASAIGVDCSSGVASFCNCSSNGSSALALKAAIAVSCNTNGGLTAITNKYNMP